MTWVTWTRDARTVVANNSGGTFHSRTFVAIGDGSTVAVSGSHVFVAWYATVAGRAYLAELSGGTWTGGQVAGAPSPRCGYSPKAPKPGSSTAPVDNLNIRTQT